MKKRWFQMEPAYIYYKNKVVNFKYICYNDG